MQLLTLRADNELKQRGVQDVLICCVDGLKGFPEAIEAVFPHAWVQTCIVHLIRHSLRFVPDKHRKKVAADLRPIYTPSTPTRPPRRSSASTPNGASATR
jgi:putative transposase